MLDRLIYIFTTRPSYSKSISCISVLGKFFCTVILGLDHFVV